MGILDFFKKGAEKNKTTASTTPAPQPTGQKAGPNQNRPATSTQPGNQAPKPAAPAPTPLQANPLQEIYMVQSGDSLSKIAKRMYGDSLQWKKIYEANKDVVKDPNLIQPGWKLKIPKK